MRGKILVVLPALLALASFAWAGGQKEGAEANVPVPDNVQWVTADRIGNPNGAAINYSVQLTYSQQASIPARVDYLTKASTEWAKAHTNYKLIPEVQGGTQEQIFQKMLQQLASNTAPDFFQIDGMFFPLAYPNLTPIDSYVSKDEVNDYFDWARKVMIDPKDNKLKGFWFITNAVGLWYRKDLIPNPPKTWDEWIATAQALKAKGYKDGMLLRGYDEQIPYGSVLPLFFGLGGKLVDDSGKPIFGIGADRDKMVETMRFWARAVKEGLVPQRVVDVKADGDMAADASKPNQVAMLLAGSWVYSQLQNVLKADLDKWDFTYTPQKTADMKGQVAGGYVWGFFTKDQKKIKAGIDFLQNVYTSKDAMANWCYVAGYTPTRASVLASPQFANDKWQLAFAHVVQVAQTRPGVKSYPILSVNLQNAFQAVILGKDTPEDAVDNAYKKTMSQLSS